MKVFFEPKRMPLDVSHKKIKNKTRQFASSNDNGQATQY